MPKDFCNFKGIRINYPCCYSVWWRRHSWWKNCRRMNLISLSIKRNKPIHCVRRSKICFWPKSQALIVLSKLTRSQSFSIIILTLSNSYTNYFKESMKNLRYWKERSSISSNHWSKIQAYTKNKCDCSPSWFATKACLLCPETWLSWFELTLSALIAKRKLWATKSR